MVGVLNSEDRPVGVGVLLGPRHVVTCAHVVNVALGLDERSQPRPDGVIRVRLPLVDGEPLRARVARWVPPPTAGAAGDDIAGLELLDPAPAGAVPARLVVNQPPAGRSVRVFGYPGVPPRPDGAWVLTAVVGRVGGGRLQLESGVDAALRVQPGFSGGPVWDGELGRVLGLVSAASARANERDSYAIEADRLRTAWPQVLDPRRAREGRKSSGPVGNSDLTVLHVSDPQFGMHHLFGGNGLTKADRDVDSLFSRLHDDLELLKSSRDLRPDLMVVTGDLAEWGMPSEFAAVTDFLASLAEAVDLPREHVAMVPGNHDINRLACQGYFNDQASRQRDPVAPFWPKWREFVAAFEEFYAEVPGATFTPDEPWTLFEMPAINTVVAGLNSTMAESHRDEDHYGWLGEAQLRWFAGRLQDYRRRGWLRLAAVHHNAARMAALDEENLRDAEDLDRYLGEPGLVNLLLHGHTHDGRLHRLPSGLIVMSTGSAAVDADARPAEVPNQYHLLDVRRDGVTRYARQYALGQKRWIGDPRISGDGSSWVVRQPVDLTDVDAALPAQPERTPERGGSERSAAPQKPRERDDFFDRVVEATAARDPGARITERRDRRYLRVARPLESGGAEQWPVGVVDGPATEDALAAFLDGVHAEFAAADPGVQSVVVHTGPPAPEELSARARQRGVRVTNYVSYQGLLDLSPLVERQTARLVNDRIYPSELYVPQRYTVLGAGDGIRRDALDQLLRWLDADEARLLMVLGDFGRGKTSLLRQLARTLPVERPGIQPVLVELRGLEKAPSLDELLAQHLAGQGVRDIRLDRLRYMIGSGRLALLFDGFDELELRVGYDNAADYLQTLLASVADRAKVVLTSRTQHFLSTDQVRTALGQRVETAGGSRVVVLEDFSEDQVLQYLTNLYDGDAKRAAARFALLGEVEDLLGLARNPRMLGFIAALEESRLRDVQAEHGRVSAAELYREIIEFWLVHEADRQRHRRGLQSLDDKERLAACSGLALKLWASTSTTIPAGDLTVEVAARLSRLAERGYSTDQAGHAIGSGSLLIRTDEGAFGFIHQSIMEWLVASAAADSLGDDGPPIDSLRRMSRLMVDFFVDLAGHRVARTWAIGVLADQNSSEISRQNALAVQQRLPATGLAAESRQMLAGVDLRDQEAYWPGPARGGPARGHPARDAAGRP